MGPPARLRARRARVAAVSRRRSRGMPSAGPRPAGRGRVAARGAGGGGGGGLRGAGGGGVVALGDEDDEGADGGGGGVRAGGDLHRGSWRAVHRAGPSVARQAAVVTRR